MRRANEKDMTRQLAHVLTEVERSDTDYEVRSKLIFKALHMALEIGYTAGIGFDQSDPEWPVVYIELPVGQVSWHMEKHPIPWDGHTTPEKYKRVFKYAYMAGR